MKLLVAIFTSVFLTAALAGFRVITPGPGSSTVVINGHAYSVLHGPIPSTPPARGSRFTLTTEAPVGSTTVTLNGVTYHVQGTTPPRPQGSRFSFVAPSTIGLHTVVMDGITYAVRP